MGVEPSPGSMSAATGTSFACGFAKRDPPVIITPMFGGLAVLLVFFLAGEIASGLGIPLPGNVIGMLLMTGALASGLLKPSRVEGAADTLLNNLAFFFVPPGVGVMVHAQLIGDHVAAISVAVIFAAGIVLVLTGITAQLFLHHNAGEK